MQVQGWSAGWQGTPLQPEPCSVPETKGAASCQMSDSAYCLRLHRNEMMQS